MARPYIKGWGRLRREAIEKSGGLCEICKIDIVASGFRIEVNHKRSVIEGGDLEDLDNLETLCPPCHKPHSASVVKRIAKSKRIAAKHAGTYRKPKGRPIQSRPMAKAYRPVNPKNRNKPVDRRGKMS